MMDLEKKYKIFVKSEGKTLTKGGGMIYNTKVEGTSGEKVMVVIDTNVMLSALQSNKGKSFELISQIGDGKFNFAISTPLLLEYEKVLKDQLDRNIYSDSDITDFLDNLCALGTKAKIFYLWRPYLKDARDDHVLEVAVNSDSDRIITFNKKDFLKAQNLGLKIQTPAEFLKELDNKTKGGR